MAQKTGKENTELKVVAETITQCVNCGVIGIPVSKNMCQKCFSAGGGATKLGEKSSSPRSRSSSSPERSLSSSSSSDRAVSSRDLKRGSSIAGIDVDELKEGSPMVVVVKREVNRCSGCRRKVGLTGFRCRCGELFCGDHRYSDRHDCSYDYKAAGRDAIARENPVCKAAKIIKL